MDLNDCAIATLDVDIKAGMTMATLIRPLIFPGNIVRSTFQPLDMWVILPIRRR